MNHVLGGGSFTSRLYGEVREKRGLAYSVYSYLSTLDRAGLIMGGVASANERVAEAIEVIRNELARLREEGITEDELRDAKTYINGAYPLRSIPTPRSPGRWSRSSWRTWHRLHGPTLELYRRGHDRGHSPRGRAA